MHKCLVSIIMPTYNSEQFIDETIDSILKQTYKNWELLITDDNSTDKTLFVIEQYALKDNRIKIKSLSENKGAGFARNISINASKGRYIAFCDSDDLWLNNKLEIQIEFMNNNNYPFTYSSYYTIDEQGKRLGLISSKTSLVFEELILNNYIGCLTAVYDAERLGKIEMSELRKRQDWTLWLRIIRETKIAYGISTPLAEYRIRENSISSNKIKLIRYNWKIYTDELNFNVFKSLRLMILFVIHYFKKNIKNKYKRK